MKPVLIICLVCFVKANVSAQTLNNTSGRASLYKSSIRPDINSSVSPAYQKWMNEFNGDQSFFLSQPMLINKSTPTFNTSVPPISNDKNDKILFVNKGSAPFSNSSYNSTSLPTPFRYTQDKRPIWQDVLGAGLQIFVDQKRPVFNNFNVHH